MIGIKLEIDALNNNSNDILQETLNDAKILDKLNEVLENENSSLKISVKDNNVIRVEEIGKINTHEKGAENVKNKKQSTFSKISKSTFKIFEEFFDSVVKSFFKKKYKINNSVYNDGKKAVVAIKNKDTKTFFKKATDAILNLIKKIPSDKKKIIKNTKNVAIDEIYSWKTI